MPKSPSPSSFFTTRNLTLAAAIAAAYVVLSLFASVFGIAFGPVQCRFSEALCVLPFLFPAATPGIFVGCFIANLLSPYGVLDIVFGSLATLLAAILTARCKNRFLAPLPPVLLNSILVGGVIAFEQTGFSAAFGAAYAFHALTIGLGEAIACYALGLPLLLSLPKIAVLRPFFGKNASYLDFPHKNV